MVVCYNILTMKYLSHSLAETEKIAQSFLETEIKKPRERALVVALSGDLGSGKTTFMQAVCKALSVKETVTSPTFVIEKFYKINYRDFTQLIHVDAYRLDGGKDLFLLAWERLVADPHNLICIEWPEKVADILPGDELKVGFTFINETDREIEY